MNCDEFLAWMESRTGQRVPENPEVTAHLRSCPACRQILALDACLEAGIQQAFTPHRLPAGLTESIDVCVDRYAGICQKPEPSGRDPVPPAETIIEPPEKRPSKNRGR